jgi:hypothetical protein
MLSIAQEMPTGKHEHIKTSACVIYHDSVSTVNSSKIYYLTFKFETFASDSDINSGA